MRFLEFRARDFRNFPQIAAAFPEGAQFICGGNGQGKTNLLEALGLVTSLRSFRTTDVSALIRWNAQPREALLVYEVEHEELGETVLEIRLKSGSKQIRLDGNPVRRMSEILGKFPTITFSSHDIQILRGAPGLRRRMMDMMFVVMNPGYYELLTRYYKALKARNALLKQQAALSQRRPFEDQLIETGWKLTSLRNDLLQQFLPHFQHAYEGISMVAEEPGLEYDASISPIDAESYSRAFNASSQRDRDTCTTNRGPHRDDLAMQLQGHEAKEFASEGQQRGLVLALRMGLVEWYAKRGGTPPVILADDIVGELDPTRRQGFWNSLNGVGQVIATGTTYPVENDAHSWRRWKMETGQISPEGEAS